jgi:hypothetical protein
MSTDTISPLRHRMIEDMNARKLGAGTGRRSCPVRHGRLRISSAITYRHGAKPMPIT